MMAAKRGGADPGRVLHPLSDDMSGSPSDIVVSNVVVSPSGHHVKVTGFVSAPNDSQLNGTPVILRFSRGDLPSWLEAKLFRKLKVTMPPSAFWELVEKSTAADIEFLAAAAPAAGDPLDEDLWGPEPDPVSATEAAMASLHDRFQARARVTENSISARAAADLIGVVAQTITTWIDSGRLLGFKVGRAWRLPLWQFDPDGDDGVLPGLAELMRSFPGGPVALSNWVQRPNPSLDDETPIDAMRSGESDRVIRLAGNLTSAAW